MKRPEGITTGRGRRRRIALLVAALLLTAAVAVPAALVIAQEPPPDELAFVNAEEDPVERKGDGRFIARPVFSNQVGSLYYGVRDPDTGDWLTTLYRVQGGEKKRQDGWEYSFEYPFEDDQPSSTRSAPTCSSCRSRRAVSSTPSTPPSPSTGPAASGTRS